MDDWSSIAVAFEAPNGTGASGSFSGTVSPTSATIKVGGSQMFTVQVSSVNNFQGQVSLSCPNAPAGISCQFASNPLLLSPSATATSSLAIGVTAKPTAISPSLPRVEPRFTLPLTVVRAIAELVAAFLLFLLGHNYSRDTLRIRLVVAAPAALLIVVSISLASCSGGGIATGGGGSPVTVQVSVQGASGSTTANLGTLAITIP